MLTAPNKKKQSGFTLVELAVAVVIIGVLAAFGVPRYLASVERARAAEAFTYLSTVSSAQERYSARQGSYTRDLTKLDIKMNKPEFFSVGKVGVPKGSKNLESGWELALSRAGKASGYGKYKVVFNQAGYDAKKSNIPDEITPRATKK